MSSGTTYSRTAGHKILANTWSAIQERHPNHALQPHERTSWDEGTDEDRAQFLRLMQEERTHPPDFLEFNLAANPYQPGQYPSAVPEKQGFPANGFLAPGLTMSSVAAALEISEQLLQAHLANFTGVVNVVRPAAGTKIYRTIGLTAKEVAQGSVTNRILGMYWEPQCPNNYANIDAWRQATAVKAEWNGDYGYIEITLKSDVTMLYGQVGMQVVDTVHKMVLPGGGYQYFIPNFEKQDPELVQQLESATLAVVIKPTRFGNAGA
jgi:hypothetical protein